MGRIGPLELAIIVVIALLLFGAGRISDIGKGLGEGIRNFKKGLRDDDEPPKQLPTKPDAKEEDTHKPA
jgi:sec-independent protein translocase protein TatA